MYKINRIKQDIATIKANIQRQIILEFRRSHSFIC